MNNQSSVHRRLSVRQLLSWIAPGLAIPMLVLTLTPAEVWKAPIDDAVYQGFDPNLIYASGAVRIHSDFLEANVSASALTTVTLATSQRQKLSAAFNVT